MPKIPTSVIGLGLGLFIVGSAQAQVRTIQPVAALPVITDPVIFDGTTSLGYAGTPVIVLDGLNAGAAVNGLQFSDGSDNSSARGLTIVRFTGDGLLIDAGADNISLTGNWLGTDGSNNPAMGNGDDGVEIFATEIVIGGTGPLDGNVINNNGDEGIVLDGIAALDATIQGNVIGLEPDGTNGSGNGDVGIAVLAGSSGHQIGGLTPAARNVISMNTEGIEINSDNNTIEGNFIGTDVTGLLDRGNHRDDGVEFKAGTGNILGGDTATAGNLIAFNAGNGVNYPAGNGNAVLFNIIHSNDLLGIDLGGDGVTENDLDDDDAGPNGLLNFPVINSATESGGIVTLSGNFDVPAGNYRFEFFVNPVGADPSGNGEGQTYVGSSTLSHSGSGPEPFGAAFPANLGDVITATLTEDLGGTYGSTSEFSDAVVAVAPRTISGIVFEDSDFNGTPLNWDGGTGDLALANVDVELYDAVDNYIASTTSAVDGSFTFTNVPDGNTFKVRARSETIGDWDTEPAGGFNASVPANWPYPLAEMTWAGAAALLGGQDPALDDTETGDGAGPGDTWVAVTVSGGDATDVNLGFAFNLITHTADDGLADANRSDQGSLRQFLKNANAIGSAAGTTANNSQFHLQMAANQVDGTDTWWRIAPTAPLPILDDGNTVIDGSTQRLNSGINSNTRGPEIELHGLAVTGDGLYMDNVPGNTVRELVINGFDGLGIVVTGASASNNAVYGCYIGTDAVGESAIANSSMGLWITTGASFITIGGSAAGEGNLISGNGDQSTEGGVAVGISTSEITLLGNRIGVDRTGTNPLPNAGPGISLSGGVGIVVGGGSAGEGNILAANGSNGIRAVNWVQNLTVKGNRIGVGATGQETNLGNGSEGLNLASHYDDTNFVIGGLGAGEGNIIAYNGANGIRSSGTGTGDRIEGNLIGSNASNGIQSVTDGVVIAGNTITRNGFGRAAILLQNDVGSSQNNNLVFHNTIYNSGGAGIEVDGLGAVVRNNIITGSDGYGINVTSGTMTESNNLVTDATTNPPNSAGQSNVALDATDLNFDPLFMDAAGGDFSLTECSSPAINAGLDLGVDQPDLNGPAAGLFTGPNPDMGALESSCVTVATQIAGLVFEDVDFAGTASPWDGGSVDVAQPNVDVELYTNSDTYVTSVTTDASGNFSFTNVTAGNYKLRVRSATLGDTDTPPAGGLNGDVPATWPYPLPEMTWGHGAAMLGGQDPAVDDGATGNDSGPGDTYVVVTVSGSDVTGVQLGFAYNLIVNTNDDGLVENLRSGQGSLRQFLKNSNAITGVETTNFALPVTDPGYDGGGGFWSIRPTLSALPDIADPAIIDGYTQFGAVPATQAFPNPNDAILKVEVNGTLLAGSGTDGLSISAGNSTVRGLAINNFTGASAHGIVVVSNGSNTVQGNFIGTDIDGTANLGNSGFGVTINAANNSIGGNVAGTGNVISGNGSGGVILSGVESTLNLIEGNFIGLDAVGVNDLGNGQDGVLLQLGASTNTVGGTSVGSGNVVSGNGGEGVAASDAGTDNNTITGNLIGTDISGALAVPNDSDGVRIANDATGNRIGGTSAAARNIISGNGARGILVGSANGNFIEGNFIGVDVGGVNPLGNGYRGIEFGGTSSGNTVGGTGAGAGNIVAHNTSNGIVVLDTAVDNRLLGNAIHDNTALGIDLGNDGVTANDPGDGDTGPNQFQNYPVLTMAATSGISPIRVEGTLNSTASTTFRIELFANTNVGSGGTSGAWNYIGTTDVTTDATGNASFNETVAAAVPVGGYVSAIATDPTGNSSEFSAYLTTTAVADHAIIVDTVDDTVDGDDSSIAALIANPGPDGMISLREAIMASNSTANDGGPDLIQFDIAGAGPHIIQPSTALPTVIDPVIIDGSSEPDFVDQPIVVLSGSFAGAGVSGLSISAGGSTVRGLVINSFDVSGIRLDNLGGNTIVGNFIGLDTTGLVGEVGNTTDGIAINQSPNNVIGGTDPADRNIISCNRLRGITIDDNSDGPAETSAGNQIVGNYIGTDVTGTVRLPYDNGGTIYQQMGIYVLNGVDTQVGGVVTGEGNVISGNDWHGVYFWGPDGHDNLIKGNNVGLDAAGSNPIGNGWESASRSAILLSNAPGNTIGGTELGAKNEIAGNPYYGILVNGASAVQNRILANSIHDNGDLGIDLEYDGVTANDADDTDVGANNLQNFPILLSAQTDGSSNLTVTGGITSAPLTAYRIEFFSSPAADGSGYGEGETYLGFVDRTTNGSGNQTFNVDLPVVVPAGHWVSATATSPTGDTSEFAESIEAFGAADLQLAKVVDIGAPNEGDTVTYTVTVSNAGPNDGTGVEVTDLLPAGVTYVSDTPSQGSYVSGTGVWTVGDVANAGSATLSLTATVNVGTAGTNVTNNATITGADQADPDAANNSDTADIGVNGVAISGLVFEDADFSGTATGWDGGTGDLALANVGIELYDGTDSYVASTTTAGDGSFSFAGLSNGNYKVRVRSATIGDADTPPTGGLHATVPGIWPYPLPEMTWGSGPLIGGQDSSVDDAGTAEFGGPGDTYLPVTIAGSSVNGIEFGFAFNLIVNVGDDGLDDSTRSAQGSLRQFLKNSNAIAAVGATTANISEFQIPGAGPHVFQPATILPAISDQVFIDGTSEPDFAGTPVIELDGTLAGLNALVLGPGSDNSLIQALVIRNFAGDAVDINGADGIAVRGNRIGTDISGTLDQGNFAGIRVANSDGTEIGGLAAGEGNLISGNSYGIILNLGATNTAVQGNLVGLNESGTAALANSPYGILVNSQGAGNVVGGIVPGSGNVVSGNATGILVGGALTTVAGNFIGTNRDGTGPVPNSSGGLVIDLGAVGNIIGGSVPEASNVISGNAGPGILISDSGTTGNVIAGNFIGIDRTGTVSLPNIQGILFEDGAHGNRIGGANPSEGNTIKDNTLDGVVALGNAGNENAIIGNVIAGNGGQGIDLNDDGITSNDDLDPDSGPNNLLNFPVITLAGEVGGTITANYDLDVPAGEYRIEFFTNPAGADPSGHGEGESFASAVTVAHTGSGLESFSHSFPGALGDVLTATATGYQAPDTYLNTSEFSAAVFVSSADLQITKVVDNNAPNEGESVTYTVTVSNAGPNDGTGIEVTDLLPAGVTYISDTPGQGAYVSGTGIWTVGDVANSGTATLTLVATMDAGTAGTNVTNNAAITGADQADPVAANNTASAVIGVSSADLQITKVVDNNAPNEGDTVTYTVAVTNAGPDNGSGIFVTDLLPAGVTYVSDTPSQGSYVLGTGVWTVGNVDNAATATLTLVATVDAGTGGSTITNNAAITSAEQADPVPANNTALAAMDIQTNIQSPIQITAVPLELRPILPGGPADDVLRLELVNPGTQPETLESLTVTNSAIGSGTVTELDNDWLDLALLVDSNGSLNPPNTTGADPVTSGVFTSNLLEFNGLAITLVPGETVTMVVQGQASLAARDGDILTVQVEDTDDILYSGSSVNDAAWPLSSAGGLTVDGMVADQLVLHAVDPAVFVVGSIRNLALDVVLPANGYEPDQLHRLNITNTGSATDLTDIQKLECWADEGDQQFNPATDTLLGEFAFTGSRWELTGLNTAIPLAGQRVFVSVDIAATATEGRTLQLGLPSYLDVGVGMESGNDGPNDRQVINPYVQAVSTADRVILSAGTIVPGTVAPGETDVPLIHLVALNSYAVDRRLVAVTVNNGTQGMGAPGIAALDGELDYLKLRVDGNGDGLLGTLVEDPVLATGTFQTGTATFAGLAWDLNAGTSSHLFLTGDVSLTGAADLDVISAYVAGAVDLTFAGDVILSTTWPLDSGARWTVDGMVAAQVGNTPAPSLTLAAGEGPALVLDLELPANGHAADTLTGLKLVNRGTATQDDLADMRLWRDGGDGVYSGGGGDDIELGPFVWVADTWLSPVLNTTLPAGGSRFFVGVTVSAAPTASSTIQMAVPVGGITVASDNDGPVDQSVEGAGTFLLSTSPLLAEIRFDQEVSTVGQNVTARMQVRNVGTETLLGVAPQALVPGGAGTVVLAGGPTPASFDMAPGAVDSFTWNFSATSPGVVTVSGLAEGIGEISSQVWPSVTTTSGPHEILEPATGLELYAVANMPFTINRGQTDVVPLTLTFVNPGGEYRSDALIHSLRIRLADDKGSGIVPNTLVSRVVVNEGGETYLVKEILESSGDEIDLVLTSPVRVTSLEPVTLGIRLDVRADAAVPAFIVEIGNADWFTATGAISENPVPILLQDAIYPIQSGLVSLLFEATQLDVAAAQTASQQVGEGQLGVDMMTLQLLNPGQAGLGSDIRVSSLSFTLTDTLGTTIATPSAYLDRLRLKNSLQTLLDVSVADHDNTVMTLDLTSPLAVPVDTPFELGIEADIAVSAEGAVRLVLADASLFQALDGNSGQAVPVVYASDPVAGGPVVIQLAASSIMAHGTPRLPSDLVIGTQQVTALDISLRHPGLGTEAAIQVASLTVNCRNEDRDPVAPAGVIDALEILRDGSPIGTIGNPGGEGEILIPVSGLELQPGQTVDLTLRLNLEAAAPPGSLELIVAGLGIHATDNNLGLPVPAHPESGEEFPLTSGLARLQNPADELRVDFASLMPAVLVESPDEVPMANIVLRNPSTGGVSGISVQALTLRAADDLFRTILVGEVAEEILLYRGENLWARSGILAVADSVAVLQPAVAEFIGTAEEVDLEVAVVLRSPHTVEAFRLGLDEEDVEVVQPVGSLVTVRVKPEDGQFFPYWTEMGSFSGASLAASYSNFPNPFAAGHEQTTFVFSLEQPATVSLRLMTAHARPVQTLISEEYRAAGLYQEDKWDGRNGNGVVIQNGVYVAELTVVYQDGTKDRQLRKVAIVR